MNFGEVPGVAVNSKGHVFVFTRSNSAGGPAYGAAAAQLLEFGPKGEYLREIGKGLYAWSEAHSVRIDKDDNIWAIDKGSDMIIKFNPGRAASSGFSGAEKRGPTNSPNLGAIPILRCPQSTDFSASPPT
jgi:streptogramin lyase